MSCSSAAGRGVGCIVYAEVSCALLPCVLWTTTKWVISLSLVLQDSVPVQMPSAFVCCHFSLLEEGALSCEGAKQPIYLFCCWDLFPPEVTENLLIP